VGILNLSSVREASQSDQ